MGLSFLEKAIVYKKGRFFEDEVQNYAIFHFCACAIAKILTCFIFSHYLFSIIFLALWLSFFSALLLSLPFSLHILSGCCKKLGVNYG